jgi:tetratricopeptide (TPR) repeat protein
MKIYTRYKKLSLWNKIGFWGAIASILGILLFFIFQYFSPTKANQEKIKKDLAQVVEMLRDELSIKNENIEFLQGEITRRQDIYPSDRARQLAQKIPDDAGPYALALKAIAGRRFKDARHFLDKAQEEKEIELAEIYITRGQTELYAGKTKDAAKWCEKALELAPDNIEIMREAGFVFLSNLMYNKAEPLLRKVLEINEKSFGLNNSKVKRSQNDLALLMLAMKSYNEAEPLLHSVLGFDEKLYGKDYPIIAADLYHIVSMYNETKRFAEAAPIIERIIEITGKSENQKDPIVAIVLNNLSVSLHSKPPGLEVHMMKRAVQIMEKSDPNAYFFSSMLINLSDVLMEADRFAEAESTIHRAITIDKQSFSGNDPIIAGDLVSLAILLRATGHFSDAELILRQSLVIYEQSSEEQNINIAGVLNDLADILIQMDRFSEADPLLRRALTIYEQSLGINHLYYASCLNNLAVLLKETNRFTESEPMMRQAMLIVEQNVGDEHPYFSKCLNNLAHLLRSTDRLSESELLFRQSLLIDEEYFGKNHTSVASDLVDLGSLLLATNRFSEAEPILNRALEIFEKILGPDHPDTQFVQKKLESIK